MDSRFLKGDELGAEFGVFFNELFDGVSGDGVRLRHYRDKKIIVASHCFGVHTQKCRPG
ncbi:hypothetical protein IZS38_002306 [Salmonella enterica subsp. enterica serovar Plymouth]|nr:hypothetical protein [Salmonella enterica subsp. enterica serovar Plymouth]EGP3852714.1 hypothetical protein [Salmonella enterica subsp. enterica serovar Plymouth]